MKRNKHSFFIVFLLCMCAFSSEAQNMVRNGAFYSDSTSSNTTPLYWAVCDTTNSTPEVFVEFVRQGISYYSLDSTTFVTMRVREDTTKEQIYTQLKHAMFKDSCYRLSLELQHTYDGSGTGGATHPVLLQVWGGTGPCTMDELLYESELIDNSTWIRYYFAFHVKHNNYPYLYIVPTWDTINYSKEVYRGIILMDNLELMAVRDVPPVLNHADLYYRTDPLLALAAMDGTTYDWEPDRAIERDGLQRILLVDYADTVLVTIRDEIGCPTYEMFAIKYDCDTVYPIKTLEDAVTYFKYDTPIILHGPAGKNYSWQPSEKLDISDEQNPTVIDYIGNFELSFLNEHNCGLNKTYHVIADCDTLFPVKQKLMMDTTLGGFSSVVLEPDFEAPSIQWQPEEGLNCVECLTPTATPFYSTLYSISITDQFNCTLIEYFNINIEVAIPNVITPNHDGYNDYFVIRGLNRNTSITIFDKNGNTVYSNNNYGYSGLSQSEKWWDGLNVKTGTFWYVLVHPDGKEQDGFILVIR